jgi:hypothetical protein
VASPRRDLKPRVGGSIKRARCGESRQATTRPRQASHMSSAFIDSLVIGFVGAILFLFVDKYERDDIWRPICLKFLVLGVGGVAILHKLRPFGVVLF